MLARVPPLKNLDPPMLRVQLLRRRQPTPVVSGRPRFRSFFFVILLHDAGPRRPERRREATNDQGETLIDDDDAVTDLTVVHRRCADAHLHAAIHRLSNSIDVEVRVVSAAAQFLTHSLHRMNRL